MFHPYTDFSADATTHERFAELLRRDPLENLAQRFDYFARQNPREAMQLMAYIPNIAKDGFTYVVESEPPLVCSVGFWYTHRCPELMLLPQTRAATTDRLRGAIQEVGRSLPGDPDGLLMAALTRHGLTAETVVPADPAFLEEHPYSFGWYFYRHFADEIKVPLRYARVG